MMSIDVARSCLSLSVPKYIHSHWELRWTNFLFSEDCHNFFASYMYNYSSTFVSLSRCLCKYGVTHVCHISWSKVYFLRQIQPSTICQLVSYFFLHFSIAHWGKVVWSDRCQSNLIMIMVLYYNSGS